MEINLSELSELIAASRSRTHSFVIGEAYLIRTITLYYTGIVVAVTDSDIVISRAAWIADTGQFYDALKTGELNEIEPFIHDVIVSRDAIVDATRWHHPLPETQK